MTAHALQLPVVEPTRPEQPPEVGLWLAVLADALRLAVLLPMTPGQERERARAVRWVFSRRDDVGGFVWCCEVLGLERGTVRAGLRRRGVRP